MTNTKTVMGFGTFDAFHPGHLFYLRELKKLGDKLVVVIARDASVLRIKGQSPHFEEETRLKVIKKADIADVVVLGSESDFYEVIRTHKPQILGFGYDQRVDEAKLRAAFPEIVIERVGSHFPEKFKSSIIKSQLLG